jgi:GTP pyrophosphokinase
MGQEGENMDHIIKRLIGELLGLVPAVDQDAVHRAIKFALTKHEGQFRIDGEPHVCHLLRVAAAAAHYAIEHCPRDLRELVQSGLLHDTVEDTNTTVQEVTELFGETVARNVSALSHIEEEEADEIYLSRVANGGRNAVLTKRFDRLDNIKTLANAPAEFRAMKLAEIRSAIPIWYRIDPEGAREIEKEVSHEQTNR